VWLSGKPMLLPTRLRTILSILLVAALPLSAKAETAESCLMSAAQHHHVDFQLLKAIAIVESSMNPNASNRNSNGTADTGMMQINDWWLPKLKKYGISKPSLTDPCISAYIGAWILSHEIAKHGATWRAVGAYNSPTPANQVIYVRKVQRQLALQLNQGR